MFVKPNTALALSKAAVEQLNLTGKRIVVVGGTDGLGREIASLAAKSLGATVQVVGRTFRDANVPNITFKQADLSLTREAARVGKELSPDTDILVLTTGIMPKATRAVSGEGVEMDMAVSALSRYVMLKEAMAGLKPHSRVFVMGFPGAGMRGALGDLNAEKTYAPGMGITHENTVVANEALVHHWAAQGKKVYGLNPGMVRTNIRANVHGNGFLGSAVETVLSWLTPTPAQYARAIVPAIVAPELDAAPGTMLGQAGQPILPTPALTDPTYVAQWIGELEQLYAKASSGALR